MSEVVNLGQVPTQAELGDALNLRGIGYLFCVASALLVFDFFVMIPHEIGYIWRRKVSMATILYFVIRYAPLISRTAVIYSLLPGSNTQTCMIVSWIYEMLVFFTLSSIAVLSALRIYAIWSLQRALLATVLFTGMILPIIHLIVRTSTLTSHAQQSMTCQLFLANPLNNQMTSIFSAKTAELLVLVSRFAATGSDGLIVLLIWLKIYATYKVLVTSKLPVKSSLIRMVFRDGVLYFFFLLMSNMSLLFASGMTNKDFDGSFDLIFSLSSILMCRFVIDLRSVHTDSRLSFPIDLNQFSSVKFISNINNASDTLVPDQSTQSSGLRILESLDGPVGGGGEDFRGEEEGELDGAEESFLELEDEEWSTRSPGRRWVDGEMDHVC